MLEDQEAWGIIEDSFKECKQLVFAKGAIILWPNETPRGVFYIKKGYVKSYLITKDGHTNLLYVLMPQSIFPILWALNKNLKFIKVFIEAMTEVEVYYQPREVLLKTLEHDTLFSRAILKYLMRDLESDTERLENLEIRSAREKVLLGLLLLARSFEKDKHKKNGLLAFPYSHQDLADSLALSRETVNREMSKLTKEGLVGTSSNRLVIKDRNLLELLCGNI